MQHRLEDQSDSAGNRHARQMFKARAQEKQKHAKLIRRMLEQLGQ